MSQIPRLQLTGAVKSRGSLSFEQFHVELYDKHGFDRAVGFVKLTCCLAPSPFPPFPLPWEASSPIQMSNSSGNSQDDQSCITSFQGGPPAREAAPSARSGTWSGWRDSAGQQQALQLARLSQLYGALHQHYMLSCPFASLESGKRVLVSWLWEPTCEKGVVDVLFKSASEVASELAELRRGTVDDHGSNEGGLLQLVGDRDLFWSSILHWHMHGTCMPIGYSVDTHFRLPRPPSAGRGDCQAGDPRVRRINEVLSLPWIKVPGEPPPPPEPVLSRPPGRTDLPPGWQDARRAWDKAFERASRIGYNVHCMFYCTPTGCAAGGLCQLRHDDKRRQRCESHSALERFSRPPLHRTASVAPTTGITVWAPHAEAARVSRRILPAYNQGGSQGSSSGGDVL
ncbi:hypothetical protein KFL_001140160 [Klebsormidium nitens]|uniref:Uncharacterized protein n=1 Tax=Klebsormidium nitens TaxID=105231 RepID=A0A1Y1I330_KLENI|nr:hypothetical protein KFL_001140160 [Klebsormidium nitens]|eukprot:GAQ82528.1 hypothetical protein KFL_001140160 [Klebsormidium nitens]